MEGCKAAALVWPLRRDWENWAPLGAAFGILKAVVGVPAVWAMDKARFGPLLGPFPPVLLVSAAIVFVAHWTLGRVAAGAARPPGGPRFAVLLATVLAALIGLLPSRPFVFVARMPELLIEWDFWIKAALLLALALLVRRWVPWPRTSSPAGPAREMVVALAGCVLLSGFALAAALALLGSDPGDPVAFLVVAAGVAFVGSLAYQRILRPWMLEGRPETAGRDPA